MPDMADLDLRENRSRLEVAVKRLMPCSCAAYADWEAISHPSASLSEPSSRSNRHEVWTEHQTRRAGTAGEGDGR